MQEGRDRDRDRDRENKREISRLMRGLGSSYPKLSYVDPLCCGPLDSLDDGAPGVQAVLVSLLGRHVEVPEQEGVPLQEAREGHQQQS